jgi:N-acetylmuramate 1-kinase
MPPEHEALLIFTRQQFPHLENVPCEVDAIVKGGSDRRFFRLHWQDPHPDMVLMVYTLARPDNAKFVPATHRLSKHGVNVPELLAHDEERLCVWMEDLGGQDLHSLQDQSWEVRRRGYYQTLDQAARIHAMTENTLSKGDLLTLEPPFDESLYLWEQNYFMDHYVVGHRGLNPQIDGFSNAHEALKKLRRSLEKVPRCLVHRDFQSQNILLRDDEAWLVDYQGLRLGIAEYDIASLLLDPYVKLSQDERDELLTYYAQVTTRPVIEIERLYYRCAAQRLMQALGAYGNLSRNQGKPHFLQHIPAAEQNLRTVLLRDPSLSPIALFLPNGK